MAFCPAVTKRTKIYTAIITDCGIQCISFYPLPFFPCKWKISNKFLALTRCVVVPPHNLMHRRKGIELLESTEEVVEHSTAFHCSSPALARPSLPCVILHQLYGTKESHQEASSVVLSTLSFLSSSRNSEEKNWSLCGVSKEAQQVFSVRHFWAESQPGRTWEERPVSGLTEITPCLTRGHIRCTFPKLSCMNESKRKLVQDPLPLPHLYAPLFLACLQLPFMMHSHVYCIWEQRYLKNGANRAVWKNFAKKCTRGQWKLLMKFCEIGSKSVNGFKQTGSLHLNSSYEAKGLSYQNNKIK